MAVTGLSVSNVANVTVTLSPLAAALRNFGALLIAGGSDVIDTSERIRQYSDLDGVVADFGTTAPEYLAADLFFSQNPRPSILYIGRWGKTASAGRLYGGAVTSGPALATLLAALKLVTTGSMTISVDGTPHPLAALDFSAIGNLNAAATIIQTALPEATVVWNAVYGRFEVKSLTTGASSAVSYASASGAGVDVSALLRLTQAAGASPPAAGTIAEQPLTAAAAFSDQSNNWYGLYFADTAITDSQHQVVAAFIEGSSPSRIYGITTQDPGVLDATVTTDIGTVLKEAGYSRTFWQYSSSSPYAAASMYARAFTVDFTANNSVITLKFKQEPGVTFEALTQSQADSIDAKNGNVFVKYQNDTAIIQQGVMANGFFFDEVHGTDWLQDDTQTGIYNLLYTTPTKIPQTDAGIHIIGTRIEQSMARGVNNGLIAPGQWNGPPIGELLTGQTLSKGYYVFVPPIALQSQSDREARVAPTIQVAIKLAGAVHRANVIINVNR